jgi:hypothetical protein
VLAEWPFPNDVVAIDEGAKGSAAEAAFNVVGHDEAMTVLRDHETYSSQILSEIMGPMLDHDDRDGRARPPRARALVAPRSARSCSRGGRRTSCGALSTS